MRAVFFSLSALDNEISLFGGIIATTVVFCAHSVVQPFKNNFYNIQECLILLNLSLVYVFALYKHYTNTNSSAVEYIILLVLAYFILSTIYTCLTTMCDSKIQKLKNTILNMKKMWKKNERISFELTNKNMSSNIPDVTFNYTEFQEPLVAVTD